MLSNRSRSDNRSSASVTITLLANLGKLHFSLFAITDAFSPFPVRKSHYLRPTEGAPGRGNRVRNVVPDGGEERNPISLSGVALEDHFKWQ